MNTNVTLPFEINPHLKTFHATAYPLGILFSKNQNAYPWLMSSYTQVCWCDNLENPLDFDAIWMAINEDFWELTIYVLETSLFSSSDVDELVLPYFKKMLSNGFYICGQYNEMYAPYSPCYKRINFEHDFLIFGYDDHDQQFDVAAYDKTRHFSAHKLSYCNFKSALLNQKNNTFNGNIIRANINYQFNFDIDKLKQDIYRYLNSIGAKTDHVYGRSIYPKLSEYVIYNNDKKYNFRVFSLLYEHKKLLRMKSEYLYENNYISNDSLCSTFQKNENTANIIYALAMKYNIRPKTEIKNRIDILLKEIEATEIPALETLLKELEDEK